MEVNNPQPTISPGYNVLTEGQIESIHQASLTVLEKTGYHVPVKEAREIYLAAGARSDGERVFIPKQLVERVRQTIKPVQLYDRLGNPSSVLKKESVVFGALSDTPHILDPLKRTVRSYVKDDQSAYGEVAFIVDENYQGRGIATYLYKMLIRLAKERGLKGFTAEVLQANKEMMKVFENGDLPIDARLENGLYKLTFPFNADSTKTKDGNP